MTHEARASAETRRVRTVTCTASVNAATHCRLDAFLRQQTVLWNASLEERIDCYRKTGKTITAFDQKCCAQHFWSYVAVASMLR